MVHGVRVEARSLLGVEYAEALGARDLDEQVVTLIKVKDGSRAPFPAAAGADVPTTTDWMMAACNSRK